MEWSFETRFGAVTVKQEGEQALCRAIGPMEGQGLYKAWLQGPGGKALLGTLIPEGGALRLRRRIPLSQLKGQGAWPPTGAEVISAALQAQAGLPAGWQWTDCPERLLPERELAHALKGVRRALFCRREEGFCLAFPCREGEPFPIPALFCLSSVERLGEELHYVFCFSHRGRPALMQELAGAGSGTAET